MTIQPVRLFGDPVLRTRADEVVNFDHELRVLVADLVDTMRARGGAGIAAPQIGVGLRVFAYDCGGASGHLVNPTFEVVGDEQVLREEGCLSVPGVRAECLRAKRVTASGFDMYGEPVTFDATDILARCVQHETDHLDGVMFMQRLDPAARKAAMRQIRESQWFGRQTVSTLGGDR